MLAWNYRGDDGELLEPKPNALGMAHGRPVAVDYGNVE
jgi:hypothetical protein